MNKPKNDIELNPFNNYFCKGPAKAIKIYNAYTEGFFDAEGCGRMHPVAEFKFGNSVMLSIDLSLFGYGAIGEHSDGNTFFFDERIPKLNQDILDGKRNSIFVSIEAGQIYTFTQKYIGPEFDFDKEYHLIVDCSHKKKGDKIFKEIFAEHPAYLIGHVYFVDKREKNPYSNISI